MHCAPEELKHVPLFELFDDEELAVLAAQVEIRRFVPRQRIFKIGEPGTTLEAVFEQQKKEPADRKVESSALRDDGFIISGMQGLKKFSVRAQRRDGEIRASFCFSIR